MKYDKTVKKKKPGEALDLQNHIAPPGSTPFPHTVPPAASHTAVKFSMYSNPQTAAKSFVRLSESKGQRPCTHASQGLMHQQTPRKNPAAIKAPFPLRSPLLPLS